LIQVKSFSRNSDFCGSGVLKSRVSSARPLPDFRRGRSSIRCCTDSDGLTAKGAVSSPFMTSAESRWAALRLQASFRRRGNAGIADRGHQSTIASGGRRRYWLRRRSGLECGEAGSGERHEAAARILSQIGLEIGWQCDEVARRIAHFRGRDWYGPRLPPFLIRGGT
jgi:hypothetical protein